jgi:hypothetical protein
VSLDVAINLHSLKLVKDELDSSINQATNEFEAFLVNQSDVAHAEQALTLVLQVAGTFKLLELPGAALLAEQMALVLKSIVEAEGKASDAALSALTQNLFVLPRYMEYLSIRHSALPTLLMPYINQLCVINKQALYPEFHFAGFDCQVVVAPSTGSPQIEALLQAISRLRHMYQVGFLGLISDKNPSPYFGQLIERSISRVSNMLVGHPNGEIWHVAKAFAACLAEGSLEVTLNRQRCLSAIERLYRQLVSQGESAFDNTDDKLKVDLLFAISLSDSENPGVQALKAAYKLGSYDLTDKQLVEERVKMYGPSLDTMASVVNVIKEELRHTKDILEIASQNNIIQSDDHKTLIDIVNRLADTLSILNLSGPMDLLRKELEGIKTWLDNPDEINTNTFLNTADTLLYIEGALSSLERREVTVAELNAADEDMRKKIISESHLAAAQRVVLEEAEAGIALSKRAISSYVESNYDSGHIANIAVTLNTVRGGLKVLNYNRAAAILLSCSAFIDGHIHDKNAGTQRHQLLETLADALISMEYYLAEVASGNKANEKILDVAEESLAALGFPVTEEV